MEMIECQVVAMKKLLSNSYVKNTTQENLPTYIVIDLKKFEKLYEKRKKKYICLISLTKFWINW